MSQTPIDSKLKELMDKKNFIQESAIIFHKKIIRRSGSFYYALEDMIIKDVEFTSAELKFLNVNITEVIESILGYKINPKEIPYRMYIDILPWHRHLMEKGNYKTSEIEYIVKKMKCYLAEYSLLAGMIEKFKPS